VMSATISSNPVGCGGLGCAAASAAGAFCELEGGEGFSVKAVNDNRDDRCAV